MTSPAKRMGDLPYDKIELVSNSNFCTWDPTTDVVAHDC